MPNTLWNHCNVGLVYRSCQQRLHRKAYEQYMLNGGAQRRISVEVYA